MTNKLCDDMCCTLPAFTDISSLGNSQWKGGTRRRNNGRSWSPRISSPPPPPPPAANIRRHFILPYTEFSSRQHFNRRWRKSFITRPRICSSSQNLKNSSRPQGEPWPPIAGRHATENIRLGLFPSHKKTASNYELGHTLLLNEESNLSINIG